MSAKIFSEGFFDHPRERFILRLLNAARDLLACAHPPGEVQTLAIDKPISTSEFPPRRLIINRCQQCGAVRMAGDDWITPLALTDLARALDALDPTRPNPVALAERRRERPTAGAVLDPGAFNPVRAVDNVPRVDVHSSDCGACGIACLCRAAGAR